MHTYFSEFEKQKNLPAGLITKTVVANQENGAWVRMERGELNLKEFAEAFSKECSQQVLITVLLFQYLNEK